MSRISRYLKLIYCCALALVLLVVTKQRYGINLLDSGQLQPVVFGWNEDQGPNRPKTFINSSTGSESFGSISPPTTPDVPAEKGVSEEENEVKVGLSDGENDHRETLPTEEKNVEEMTEERNLGEVTEERYPVVHTRVEARMSHIREVCERVKPVVRKCYNMYYFEKFGVTWLPVFKSSSTTWKLLFINEILGPDANYKGDHTSFNLLFPSRLYEKNELKPANRTGPRKRQWAVEPPNSIRFTIVRHPLSRLVSHYRKTMVSVKDQAEFKDEWIIPTVVHAREKTSWTAVREVKYRGELDPCLPGTLKPDPNTTNPYLSLPTFPEFIEFIFYARAHHDWRGTNEHWKPNWARTDVCYNDLDIITKLENELDELPYLLDKLNMTQYSDRLMNTKANLSGVSNVEGGVVLVYLEVLGRGQQEGLNTIYTFDYEVFKYEPIFTFSETKV
eukprot:sb/3479739/